MFAAEDLAGASHGGQYFVGKKQYAPLIAELAEFGEEIIRRHDAAAPALDGFDDECRHLIGGGFTDKGVVELKILFSVK